MVCQLGQGLSLLSPWSIRRTPARIDRVNDPLAATDLAAIRAKAQRGRPYGDQTLTGQLAD